MKISIFGLGYVGAVTAACLAAKGHSIIGVDVDPLKLDSLARSESPIVEEGLSGLIQEGTQNGNLRVTSDHRNAVENSDAAIVCVGTPGNPDGSHDMTAIRQVAAQIGSSLKMRSEPFLVIIRSTLLPGSTSGIIIPALETESAKKIGRDFDICLNPEFMREGTAIEDFYNPPFTVVGSHHREAANRLKELYGFISAPFFATSIEVAEMVKCTCNAFHALKIAFANEVGSLCKNLDINGREVMEILRADTKLNSAGAYLTPAYAFGGACLPKDLRALEYQARRVGCEIPLIRSILPSNGIHIERVVNMVLATGRRSIGLLGLSFKQGSDDLRESPLVDLAKSLLEKGLDLTVYDEDIRPDKLIGANLRFITSRIPDFAPILAGSREEFFGRSELIILGKKFPWIPEFLRQDAARDSCILDLVGIRDAAADKRMNYSGICW
ncbi:MAG: nucleotide sugar dehydrogenase [Acidobacteria bacterium]|nr:nucleotide sugar dehydrogenase [Acidobacteriota bacterium]